MTRFSWEDIAEVFTDTNRIEAYLHNTFIQSNTLNYLNLVKRGFNYVFGPDGKKIILIEIGIKILQVGNK